MHIGVCDRSLATVAVTALLYNFGFFTLLAFTPFPLAMSARQIGLIFFGWGIGLAITSVFVAPRLQRLFGTLPVVMTSLLKLGEEINVQIPFYVSAFAVVLAVGVLATGWKPLSHLRIPANHSTVEAQALTTADA